MILRLHAPQLLAPPYLLVTGLFRSLNSIHGSATHLADRCVTCIFSRFRCVPRSYTRWAVSCTAAQRSCSTTAITTRLSYAFHYAPFSPTLRLVCVLLFLSCLFLRNRILSLAGTAPFHSRCVPRRSPAPPTGFASFYQVAGTAPRDLRVACLHMTLSPTL